MAATYNWKLGIISGKKSFTDKNGIVRENVIKSVELTFEGVETVLVDGKEQEKKQSRSKVVFFDLFDLSLFQDYTQLDKETVLNWALNTMHPKEKKSIEDQVKIYFEYDQESNSIQLEIND